MSLHSKSNWSFVTLFTFLHVFLLFRTTVRLACLMDLINYPMDEQQCPMQISSCTPLLFFPAFLSTGKRYAIFDKLFWRFTILAYLI